MTAVATGFIFGLIGMFVVPKDVAMFGTIGGILIGGAVDYLRVDVLPKLRKKVKVLN